MKAEGPYNCVFNLSALKQIRIKNARIRRCVWLRSAYLITVKSLRVAKGMGA